MLGVSPSGTTTRASGFLSTTQPSTSAAGASTSASPSTSAGPSTTPNTVWPRSDALDAQFLIQAKRECMKTLGHVGFGWDGLTTVVSVPLKLRVFLDVSLTYQPFSFPHISTSSLAGSEFLNPQNPQESIASPGNFWPHSQQLGGAQREGQL